MSVDNPFEEDSDRTVIRPAPGGRRAAAPASPASGFAPASSFPDAAPAPVAAPVVAGEGAERLIFGGGALLSAAAPLLQLLARLRNTANQPDPADLRERAMREVRNFEQAARAAGVPEEQLAPAHYALCASLDDVVLNTPWGSSGVWDQRSLVSSFHKEVRSGERFFQLLDQAKNSAGTFLPVLELMYLCLSLGFMGRYRLAPRGASELEKVREDVYATIMRQRAAGEPGLSPQWMGASAPYRPARASLPVWVVGVAGLALVGGLFAWFSTSLNAASDDVLARMMSAPPQAMPAITRTAIVVPPPPPPPPPEPGVLDKLRTFLKPEIDAGLVLVLGDENTPIVRIRNKGVAPGGPVMFGSGNASVQPAFIPILERIGTALKQEQGSVQVLGHSDNQPIRTVRFPSNFHLSAARAEAAREIILRTLGEPGRIKAEGRADAEPVASNATAEGRDENRRIEVVLRRQG
jgi:type VI secretion system protein ImpK